MNGQWYQPLIEQSTSSSQPQLVSDRLYNKVKEKNPFVSSDKYWKSKFSDLGAGFVTFGNALNNGCQAYFNLSSAAGVSIGGVAAVGTFAAMVKLYGDAVFPGFQGMLTSDAEQEEYKALIQDLVMAKKLGLHEKDKHLRSFLKRSSDERREVIARKKIREGLSSPDLNLDKLFKESISHVNQLNANFLQALLKYFVKEEALESFFKEIYKEDTNLVAPEVENQETVTSLLHMEIITLRKLKTLEDSQQLPLDLKSAFSKVSFHQQWLWTKQTRSAETEEKQLSGIEQWFWSKWYDKQIIKTEKERRRAALSKALAFSPETILEFEGWVKSVVSAGDEKNKAEIQQFFDEELTQASSRLSNGLKHYRRKLAEQAYNFSFKAFWEKLFLYLGFGIGFFGAAANAALGFLGLQCVFLAMGFTLTPTIWILIGLGMSAGFLSSFMMTRLRIMERLSDLGRQLDKNLPIENRRLRYAVVVLGISGSVAPAWLAFFAGKTFMLSFVGAASPVLLFVALIFAVATLFGAGALMVEGLYENIEPYVRISEASFYEDKWARYKAMLRLFFLGEDKLKNFTGKEYAQIFLARILGLALLVGAIASQISLGASPFLIVGMVFAIIGMTATYGGVFEVAKDVVEKSFSCVEWVFKHPGEAFSGLCWVLFSAAVLQLSISSAVAWITHATVLGIATTVAPFSFCIAMLGLLALIAASLYYYRTAMVGGGDLSAADTYLEEDSRTDSLSPSQIRRSLSNNPIAVPVDNPLQLTDQNIKKNDVDESSPGHCSSRDN